MGWSVDQGTQVVARNMITEIIYKALAMNITKIILKIDIKKDMANSHHRGNRLVTVVSSDLK